MLLWLCDAQFRTIYRDFQHFHVQHIKNNYSLKTELLPHKKIVAIDLSFTT